MLIASKYEEIYAPEVKDFEYITDRAYGRSEILECETQMLSTINFNVTTPSSF
jgi:cyclin B